jgi:hypothetical protein
MPGTESKYGVFDARKKILGEILKLAQHGMAEGMRDKFGSGSGDDFGDAGAKPTLPPGEGVAEDGPKSAEMTVVKANMEPGAGPEDDVSELEGLDPEALLELLMKAKAAAGQT